MQSLGIGLSDLGKSPLLTRRNWRWLIRSSGPCSPCRRRSKRGFTMVRSLFLRGGPFCLPGERVCGCLTHKTCQQTGPRRASRKSNTWTAPSSRSSLSACSSQQHSSWLLHGPGTRHAGQPTPGAAPAQRAVVIRSSDSLDSAATTLTTGERAAEAGAGIAAAVARLEEETSGGLEPGPCPGSPKATAHRNMSIPTMESATTSSWNDERDWSTLKPGGPSSPGCPVRKSA